MAIAIALIGLVLATVLFHFLSPWQLTPLASNWGSMDTTIDISFWVTGAVFVAVNVFMAYAILRYRYDPKRRSLYEPENKRLELWLTGLTTIGIAALLAPGLFVWLKFVTVPDDAHEIEVIGQQWHWSFRFPGPDGQFGKAQTSLITDENPFGIDPDDPRGRDDVPVPSNRVLLPLGRPVKTVFRSKDVLHNFQVAQFRTKMDLVPGQASYTWLTPTRTGDFEILCAELCGIGHFTMRGLVRVVEAAEFDAWLARQPSFGQIIARRAPDHAAGQELYATCTACHGAAGEGNPTLNAPKIAGLGDWYIRRQLQHFKAGVRGAHEKDPFGPQMLPFANLLADEAAVDDVAAYIRSLPDTPVASTITGDAGRGERIYRTCGACHGPKGQGVQAMNAPRLAGVQDWYLVRQLENFRQGIRGAHADDPYGWQMVEMAKIPVDEQGLRSVVAYINTLPVGTPSRVAAVVRAEE